MSEVATHNGPAKPSTSLWRKNVFIMLFTARVLSVTGDWVYQVALIWLVLQITGSSSAVSLVSLAQIVPLVAMSLVLSGRRGGTLSPRGLAAVDVAQAVAVMVLPTLYWLNALNIVGFVVLGVVIAVLDSLADPGLQAIVPLLFERGHIPNVHSLLDLTKRLGRIAGPGLVSLLLLVLPIASMFTIDAASFLVSASLLLAISRSVRRSSADLLPTAKPDPAPRLSLRQTRQHLRENPILLWLFTVRNAENLLWAVYLIGTPVLVRRDYHQGPAVWSALIVVYALGQILGNAFANRRRGYAHVRRYVICGWALAGLGFVGLGAFDSPWLGAMALLAGGAGSAAANVSTDSYVGLAVPVHLQTAAFSWQYSGNQITQLAGIAAFGILLDFVSARPVIAGAGIGMGVGAVLALAISHLRGLSADHIADAPALPIPSTRLEEPADLGGTP